MPKLLLLASVIAFPLLTPGCASAPPPRADAPDDRALASREPGRVGPQCRARIFWACPAGFVDGCGTPASTGFHVCVPGKQP